MAALDPDERWRALFDLLRTLGGEVREDELSIFGLVQDVRLREDGFVGHGRDPLGYQPDP